MPKQAKLYIGFTIAAGFATLASGFLFERQFPDSSRFYSYFLLAIIASTLKVRLPGIRGTMSVNFLFILLGSTELTFSETMLVGCAAAVVQCVWKPRQRPQTVQILFNVAVLAISIGVSYHVSHYVLTAALNSLSTLLALTTSLYFITNTLLVAAVLALVEQGSLQAIWRQCNLWTLPYYLAGAAISGLIAVSSRSVGWKVPLLMLPLMYLIYTYYRTFVARAPQEPIQARAKVVGVDAQPG